MLQEYLREIIQFFNIFDKIFYHAQSRDVEF